MEEQVDMRHRGPPGTTTKTTSGAVRRNSVAEFTDLRRRYTATNHVAGTQFRGLVIPPPAADASKSSTCFLPTITATKPQSKLPLTTQERRRSSGYQSVLAGSFSSLLSNRASNAQRRSSVYGYPVVQQSSSTSSSSRSLIQPSRTSPCLNNVDQQVDGDLPQPQHPLSEFGKPPSRRPLASADCTDASDDTPTTSIHPHNREDELADGRLLSRNDSSSPTATESVKMNSLKVDEEQPDNGDVELVTLSWPSGRVDADCCTVSECQPDSLDHSVVSPIETLQLQWKNVNEVHSLRLPGDWRETASDAARDKTASTAADADDGNRVSSSETSDGQQQAQIDDKFNGFADDEGSRSLARPDSASLTNIIINKGNLGLGFCITGGRGSTTGDDRIVVKRIFKGTFIVYFMIL